ncbi:MAG: aminotransferase class III-fold pyridoxal phosphate-dependent enzyme [Elusimicrobia bacterium]|nr:aminotransferase class III-fold pyridoxal phosphate-dependent enzyme [Elusimicrobiota bacterium]
MAYRYPESPVFYRALNRAFPKIVKGEGCWLVDENGKRYLDACGGAFVANLGHGVVEISQALAAQAAKVAYVNGTAFTNEPAEELARELSSLGPKGLGHCYFLCSGSEAVEAALKLARQYWAEIGQPGKTKIISQSPGYHGNTLLALSASARGHYKKLFSSWLVPVPMIAAPYPYRCSCAGLSGKEDCPDCSGDSLEKALIKEDPSTVAAFIAEPVGGSSTGASVPRPDYWRRIREICDKHDIFFIADEVLTGAGRTGKWTALEHYGVSPDIMILGKGLSGGYAPLSVMMTSDRLAEAVASGSGSLKHAQTFSHTPLICAAGLAAARYIKSHGLIERAAKTGEILQARLKSLLDLPAVGDVRGIGMLAGIEFVSDKKTKKPFDRSRRMAETFVDRAQENGLVLWPNVGQAGGENGDLVMVAPPFIIGEDEIEEIVSRFKKTLSETMELL